jgi:UDP-N-acetylmuramate dehydrogenase
MIDELGLKGYRVGDAEVSSKHAGFIVNRGQATARDVLALVSFIQQRVKEKFGVDLETEFLIIGED